MLDTFTHIWMQSDDYLSCNTQILLLSTLPRASGDGSNACIAEKHLKLLI